MKSILASCHTRDDIPTIKAIFRKLKFDDKVCLRQVLYISTEGFVLLNDFYGEVSKPTIYLMHRTNHFFLGLAWYSREMFGLVICLLTEYTYFWCDSIQRYLNVFWKNTQRNLHLPKLWTPVSNLLSLNLNLQCIYLFSLCE